MNGIAAMMQSPLLIFLVLAGIAGLAAGAVLTIRPQWLERAGVHVNRWIATRRLDALLERAVDLDKWFYRHHQASGLLMLAGACWIIVFLVVFFNKFELLVVLGGVERFSRELVEGMADGLVLLALAGSVFAAMVSLFLLLRPSLLREFEQGANQWVSTRQLQEALEIPRGEVDRYVMRHSRLFGLLLLLGSLFVLGILAFWYGGQG